MLSEEKLWIVWLASFISATHVGGVRRNFDPRAPLPRMTSYPGPSACSEFVTVFPSRPPQENEYARPETLLVQCNEENTGTSFGFRAFELECGVASYPRPIRNASGEYPYGPKNRQVFTVATPGKVRLLKSFVDGERGFLIALLERRHSIIYTVSYEESKSRLVFHAVKLQDIRYPHLTDVAVIHLPRGEPFIAFSAYNYDTSDRSKQYESVAPVYRFRNKHLDFCSFAPVIRSVAVCGWFQQGLVTLVYASYSDSESERSQLNLFEVDLQGDGAAYDCQVRPRETQPAITAVDGKPFHGVQSVEVIQRDGEQHLAVALSPLEGQNVGGSNELKDSFILRPDPQTRPQFDPAKSLRLPGSTNRFTGLKNFRTDCGQFLIGSGILSNTRLFSLDWSAQAMFVTEVPVDSVPPYATGSGFGYCEREPVISLTRPDALGVSTHWVNCDALSTYGDEDDFDEGRQRPRARYYDDDGRGSPSGNMGSRQNYREDDRVSSRGFRLEGDMLDDPIDRSGKFDEGPGGGEQSENWSNVRSYKLRKAKFEAERAVSGGLDRRRPTYPEEFDQDARPRRVEEPDIRSYPNEIRPPAFPPPPDRPLQQPPPAAFNASRFGPVRTGPRRLPRPPVPSPQGPTQFASDGRNVSQSRNYTNFDENPSFNRPFNGSLHPISGPFPNAPFNGPVPKQKPRGPDGKLVFRQPLRRFSPPARNRTVGPRFPQRPPDRPPQRPLPDQQEARRPNLRDEDDDSDNSERDSSQNRRGANRMEPNQMDPFDSRPNVPPWDRGEFPPRQFPPPDMPPRYP